MVCHRCAAEVRPSQRFCDQCGASLRGVTDETEELRRPPLYDFAADPDEGMQHLDAGATTDVLTFAPPSATSAPGPGAGGTEAAVRTTDRTVELPLVVLDADDDGRVDRRRFGVGPLLVLALLSAVGAAVAAVATTVTIDTDAVAPAFETGSWSLADLGTNLSVALLVTAAALAAGAVAHGFRQRWGAGLAGGAGMALAGMAGLVVGLAEQPIQLAQGATSPAGAPVFTVSITRDVGYVVVVLAGIAGVIVFLLSLRRAGRDPSGGLNPWIAALGALAAIVAAAGPLVPEGGASVSSNWTSGSWYVGDVLIDQPTAFFAGRLLQASLLAGTGVLGFLLVRRYGLGLVVGGATASIWLSVATLFELGDTPVGPAFGNPGSADRDLHSVTIVGMVALVGLAIVAIIAAIDQSLRDR
jgi:hypothetical protein